MFSIMEHYDCSEHLFYTVGAWLVITVYVFKCEGRK